MNPTERVPQLFSQILDGNPSDSELAELSQLLKSNAAGRDLLIDHLLIDSLLSEQVGKESLTALVDAVGDPPQAVVPGRRSPGRIPRLPSRLGRLLSWITAAAALVLVAYLVGRWDNPTLASPVGVVRAALVAHHQAVERIYQVEVHREQLEERSFLAAMRDVRVHTQGDRFYVEVNRHARRWVWGRDQAGAFWLTLGPNRAMRIDADEAGVPLQLIGDLYGLELGSLLESCLTHCDLEFSDESESLHVIRVTPKQQWHRRLQSATIEVDRETKAIRRLILNKLIPEHGKCSITFTLVDSGIPDESKYSVEGHLDRPFNILSRERLSEQRRQFLSNWNGAPAARWIK